MKFYKYASASFTALVLLFGTAHATPDFLPPEKAFQAEASWSDDAKQIEIAISPVKGYYIYQNSLHFRAGQNEQNLTNYEPVLPQGVEKFDETFQRKLLIYKQPFTVTFLTKSLVVQPLFVELELQGCAEAGICYPPMTMKFLLTAPGVKAAPIPEQVDMPLVASKSNAKETSLMDLWRERDDVNAISRFLANTPTIYLFAAFFILGLALAFTPCVLPMLPIMSSVVFGTQGNKAISKRRASILAIAYVFGMAIMYSLAGVLMAALGASVQRTLQSPIAIASFAVLLLILSGSLFGFYHLRLPHAWHHQIDRLAGRQKGGSVLGALALGGISTLVASPCITAPLAGVLTFIAQTGSMSLGAGLLFVMALGMGLPLLFIAIEARVFIPSTGMWMVWLQRFLGVLLVATAIWIASPLFSSIKSSDESQISNGQATRRIGHELYFTVIESPADLEHELAKAKAENKWVMLDFYADWCVSCKEMEVNTFENPAVANVLNRFTLLQADVTKNSTDNQALLKRFGLFGPPGILLFNPNSQEQTDQRVIGYMPPQRFLERLKIAQTN
jgi:thiol:disulfide interchange protein DsbD